MNERPIDVTKAMATPAPKTGTNIPKVGTQSRKIPKHASGCGHPECLPENWADSPEGVEAARHAMRESLKERSGLDLPVVFSSEVA